MVQRCQNFGFTLKPDGSPRIARELLGEDFDGDVAFEFGVACPIHLAHSSLTKQGGDLVCAEVSADGDRHEGGAIITNPYAVRHVLAVAFSDVPPHSRRRYSGYKANERPRYFTVDEDLYE